MFRALNCGMEIVCMVISFNLLIQVRTFQVKRETDRWFRMALVSNLGVLVSDLAYWICNGTQYPFAHFVMLIANPLFFVSGAVYMFGIFGYVYTYANSKKELPRQLMTAAALTALVQILLVSTTPLTGAAFTISADNVYVRGPLWILTQVSPMVIFGMVLWIYTRVWSLLKRREKIWFALYFVFALLGMVLQDIIPNVAFNSQMFTLILLMISMFIHVEMDDQLRTAEQRLEQERIQSLQTLQKKQSEVMAEVIQALSDTSESKDHFTTGHSQRVAVYAKEIARRLGWDEDKQERVYFTGLLHDVGKIRVPTPIINKEGPLTPEELSQIRQHSMAGYYILKEITSVKEFAIGARWHHERYDGTGYPNGLSGENIPLIARIIALADAYDAMTSDRSYRGILPQAQVREEIEKGAGTQFDPALTPILLQMIDEDPAYRMRQPDLSVQRTVLAIDDDPMVHKLLEMLFRSQPLYKLRTASTGQEGLDLLGREAVDLVLLDMEMPGMNGFETLTRLRADHHDMPVIFMTGDKDVDIIQRAEQLGVNDYLTKPLVASVLMDSIRNVLTHSLSLRRTEFYVKGGRTDGE